MDIYSKKYTHHSRSLGRSVSFRRDTARYILFAFIIAGIIHGLSLLVLISTGVLKDKNMIELTLSPYEQLEQLEKDYLEVENPPKLLAEPEETRREPPPDDLENPEMPEGPTFSESSPVEEPQEENKNEMFSDEVPLSPRSGGIEGLEDFEKPPLWSSDLIIRPEFRNKNTGRKTAKDDMIGETITSVPRPTGPDKPVYIPQDDLNELAQQRNEANYNQPRRFGLGFGNTGPRVPQSKNRHITNKDYGNFSLSTYAWDYAPYLYILKERVRRRWFPPEAFNLGLVSGRVIIRFKIMPTGELRDMEVLSYRDNDVPYQSLVESSRNAILSSSPFPPLPEDFIHPFLEITGTFYYQIQRAR